MIKFGIIAVILCVSLFFKERRKEGRFSFIDLKRNFFTKKKNSCLSCMQVLDLQ